MQLDWLYRGTSEIFPDQPDLKDSSQNLAHYLQTSDRPLRIKLGIDPTGTDIHLGHSIPFRKLRAFQDAGHIAVVIIGDFTAQIGDPTGKSEVRQQLTPQAVEANAKNYLEQLRPILDFETPDRLEIRYNSEWLSKLDLSEILTLLSTMTVGQMLAKEGFNERYTQENPIFLHEFLYPLMQGYDSVAVDADVELGGTDQKFNIAVGRDLQRHFGKKPQFGLLLPILIGTDGSQKMSKSLNNYVGLREDALSMYSKLEKTPDSLIKSYFELLTKVDLDKLPDNPRECQKMLALDVVSQFHGKAAAIAAQSTAAAIVTQGRTITGNSSQTLGAVTGSATGSLTITGNSSQTLGAVTGSATGISSSNTIDKGSVLEYSLSHVEFPAKLFYILSASKLCASSSEGRRQIEGGAVRLEGDRISDVNLSFSSPEDLSGKVLQVGKKKFIRLVL